MIHRATGIGGVLLAVSWLVACGDAPPASPPAAETAPPPRPNIVLVVIDNLRADHLGAYGYPRPTSPNIDGLVGAGVLFRNAFAPSSWTKPSIGALFTSRYPSEHHAVSFARHLDESIPTLAEAMQQAGYVTMGFAGNFIHVRPETGMARGFDHWETINVELAQDDTGEVLWVEPTPDGRRARMRPPLAHEINNPLAKKLLNPVEKPLFLYVHYMEPHASYAPADVWREKFVRDPAYEEGAGFGMTNHIVELARGDRPAEPGELERLIDLYDAEIAAADAGVGVLLRRLRRLGLLQNSVVAVVSDHGEAFAEHGTWFHGGNLHTEQVAVPIVLADMREDPVVPAGRVDERAVDLLDVPTTLLALAGAGPSTGMRGRNLLADQVPPRDLVAELHPERGFEDHLQGRGQRLVLTRWPDKLVVDRSGPVQHFDLVQDRAELNPATAPASLAAVARAAVAELDRALEPAMQTEPAPLDEQTREGLRSLGYIE